MGARATVLTAVALAFLIGSAATAAASPELASTGIEIDATADEPTLELDIVYAVADERVPITLFTSVGDLALAPACNFIGTPPEAGTSDGPETVTVTFQLVDVALCDLRELDTGELVLTASGEQLTDESFDTTITATLTTTTEFDTSRFESSIWTAVVLAAAAVVASLILAWITAGVRFSDWNPVRLLAHPIESKTVKWTFSGSWLSTLTAAGAVLATVLGATDALDAIGQDETARAGFVLVNLGALALTAAGPLLFNVFRRWRRRDPRPRQELFELRVQSELQNGTRTLVPYPPAVTYEATENGERFGRVSCELTPSAADSTSAGEKWERKGRHLARVAIPSEGLDGYEAPGTARVAVVDVPAHDGDGDTCVYYHYRVALPHLATKPYRRRGTSTNKKPPAPKRKVHAIVDSDARYEPRGTFIGLAAAALAAGVAVLTQLLALRTLLDESTISDDGKAVANGITALLIAATLLYILTSLRGRLAVVQSPDAPAAPMQDVHDGNTNEPKTVSTAVMPYLAVFGDADGPTPEKVEALTQLIAEAAGSQEATRVFASDDSSWEPDPGVPSYYYKSPESWSRDDPSRVETLF